MYNRRNDTSPINLVAGANETVSPETGAHSLDPANSLASEQITLKDLERLLALNNADSYTEAAYRLQISEAHLRRKIRAMEKAVGFVLIEKKSDRRLGLSVSATQWLKSFRELHIALKSLDQAIQDVHQLNQRINIGLDAYLSFSSRLWDTIPQNPETPDQNQWILHPGGDMDKLNNGEFEAFLGIKPARNENLVSQLVYRDHIVIYQQTDGEETDSKDTSLSVILQAPVTETQIRELFSTDPKYQGKELSFIHAMNATEALQYVSHGIGIFPSISLCKHIIPSNVEATTIDAEAYADIYMICQPSKLEALLADSTVSRLRST
ncbi:DNA-binding transcriptional regulator, LysR family [Rubritalea squalenifaciens DSM 18772]|uniref:DNA-binding transcriptional regulator, LysR family n=2 Tax=Rubritalea TaxID=361050 RepID=A0A1M6PCM8_9BACT|nr:LysR family transcriptional regulator [Rubritalea squalenifaciens]SHK05721.1 DNA-binding transcriptional regulator, LysR family [Rubritalea squalenifaciens DSM 18772]